MYHSHYENQLKKLKSECKESLRNIHFYKYYRSGRNDCDHRYFKLGQVNYLDDLHNDVFEIDLNFSTYYDNKVAHIIANEILYSYLLTKISPEETRDKADEVNKDISWTTTQNALIELIYALHASRSISYGKIGLRKIALIFEVLFNTPLNNIHHAFHRMKSRSGSRTAYLDELKYALEDYMDKDIWSIPIDIRQYFIVLPFSNCITKISLPIGWYWQINSLSVLKFA